MSFLSITKKEFTAAGKGGTLFTLVPAGRRQFCQERKTRTGEQAEWERTGPGQTGPRHGLAIKKNVYRQPPGNTSPASLGSQMKRGRATTGLWLLRGKLCGVVKHLGNQAAAWQIHASNSYPTFQGSAMQCSGCDHLIARQMEEEGSIQHALLSCCCTKNDTQSRMKKSLFIHKQQRAKNNPTFPENKTKQKPKKTKAKVTVMLYWNQHYRLHVKHAQENVLWELILYMECVSSAL